MDLDNIWQKYCQRNLQSVAVHVYLLLIMQLGTSLSVAMVTDLKKRQAQELTAANCIVPDLCEKNVALVSTLAVDIVFSTH